MTFSEYWSAIGQRNRVYSAMDWCEVGWNAHRMHGDNDMIESDPIPEEVKLLENGNAS